ncbi:MAG: hypothetical protein WCQ95_01775 [Bacteroidota bacterium]
MTIQELIKSYKTFYHITKAENENSILANGLIPNRYSDMDYHHNCPEKKAQICLTTYLNLNTLLSSFKDNDTNIEYTVFEVPADFIATINFGLDWTFSGTETLAKMDVLKGIKISIETLGTLACFDIIPKEVIKKYINIH